MGNFNISDFQLLEIIENSRKKAQSEIERGNLKTVESLLKKEISSNLFYVNNSKPYHYSVKDVGVEDIIKQHDYKKTVIGSGLILVGQPILKKRFVTRGSATGTSIASKYLSKALPYKMPFNIYSINMTGRIVSTRNLGRGLGRLAPMVGTALLIIDVVELLIEVYELNRNSKINKVRFIGFGGGGSFGGGGTSGEW